MLQVVVLQLAADAAILVLQTVFSKSDSNYIFVLWQQLQNVIFVVVFNEYTFYNNFISPQLRLRMVV